VREEAADFSLPRSGKSARRGIWHRRAGAVVRREKACGARQRQRQARSVSACLDGGEVRACAFCRRLSLCFCIVLIATILLPQRASECCAAHAGAVMAMACVARYAACCAR